jgi:predicted RNA binding protein YcfA (HicA-like mRNA interferase family)
LARLKPQPFREVKRRLEATGLVETSQKGSHVKFVRRTGEITDTVIVPRRSEIRNLAQYLESGAHRSRRMGWAQLKGIR